MSALAARVLRHYRHAMALVGEDIAIRRYTGTGTDRTYADVPCRAKVSGYAPEELVGSVVQGDRKVILLAQELEASSPPFVPTRSDRVMLRGGAVELAILAIDNSTRRIGATLIAYELQCRG